MVSSDARVQAKINDLYSQTRQLLNQYLDADELETLLRSDAGLRPQPSAGGDPTQEHPATPKAARKRAASA